MKCPHCDKEVFSEPFDVADLYEEPKKLTPEEQFEQLQAKYKKLKEKAKIIKVGNVPAPDFNPDMGLGKNVKFSLHDPESAYLWGWEGAIFECGEILSKP